MFRLTRAVIKKSQRRYKSRKKFPLPILQPKVAETGIFYNNQWNKAKSGKTLKVYNPTTGEAVTEVEAAGKEDVDAAITSASKAFEYESQWRTMNASDRGKLLYKLASLVEKDAVLLASLETLNNGIPYVYAYSSLLKLSIRTLRYFAGWADKFHAKTIPMDGNFFCYTRHEPVGVCVGILPWNVPILSLMLKLAPAIALGNTLVLKPSRITPLTALHVAELTKKAGFPPGVINVTVGGADVGELLCKHPKVDKISFTGSTEVGKLIQTYAIHSNFKRTSLELGGKNPVIVFADFNLKSSVEGCHQALFFNQGQACTAGSKTFVEAKIYDEFVEKSVERAKNRVVGDPFDVKTEHGPQINQSHMEHILGLIDKGIKDGSNLKIGGKRIGDKGFFIQPTVFADVQDHHMLSNTEIFGPVQQLYKFDKIGEVLKRANNSNYGLGAGIYTQDMEKMTYLLQGLRAGSVWINGYGVMGPHLPFGGYKDSGWGRELGEYGLQNFTEVKNVVIKIKKKSS